MKKKLILLLFSIIVLAVALLAIILVGLGQSNYNPLKSTPSFDQNTLVTELKKEKGEDNITTFDESPNDFFPVSANRISINGTQVDVFEFADVNEVDSQAVRVSADGTNIDGYGQIFWENPHFYKKDKLIVFYDGNNREVLDVLEKYMGKQFAGN